MNRYSYSGPVYMFDVLVSDKWQGETMAASEKKARSNLTYQYKKQTGRLSGSKISLPGKLTLVP